MANKCEICGNAYMPNKYFDSWAIVKILTIRDNIIPGGLPVVELGCEIDPAQSTRKICDACFVAAINKAVKEISR